jgi:hypothetical protein
MKLNTHIVAVVTFLLSAAALPALAAPDSIELLGTSATPSPAAQEIRITPKTTYVNVTGGDAVNFIVGDKAFGWIFDGSRNVGSFDLNDVAPRGVLDHPVTVYIAPDPRRLGGS